MSDNQNTGISRRKFLKIGGLAGSAVSLAGVAGAGYIAGKDTDSYTGWERYTHGGGQFFNRKPFERDNPTYEVAGKTRRINYIENIFSRNGDMYRLMYPGDGSAGWSPEQGIDKLPEPLKSFYKKKPESLELFKETMEASKEQRKNWGKYKYRYAIADAWSDANSAPLRGNSFPQEPDCPPEEWDYQGVRKKRLSFKSPDHAATLVKKIAHTMGATLVGITKLNHDWVYKDHLRGVGNNNFDVPRHWKYAVVVASPHEWDAFYANPTYGTSYDAYSREKIITGKLQVFIRKLGYSARSHVPPMSYELAVTPLAVDAGIGELGRNGICVSPELGANTRLAAVTTDLPMTPDKPVDVGIHEFCKKCKICAEQCPGGAICFDDEPTQVIRGYKRWNINDDKCFLVWNKVATSHARGCRVCLSVCPYSRKNNWIHNLAREIDPRDPTGISASLLLAMQKGFFEYPEANDYLPPPDGKNATYHDPPDWLQTEKWCDENETI